MRRKWESFVAPLFAHYDIWCYNCIMIDVTSKFVVDTDALSSLLSTQWNYATKAALLHYLAGK